MSTRTQSRSDSTAADAPAPAPDAALQRAVAQRRTFAIISHPDAGKTTLTEKLLLFGGAIQMAGTVKARKTGRYATSDWMEVERQRGISVTSSVMQFEYAGHVLNLLDTPGHQDFSEDTYRVLTAVDAALMVIDAGKGVESQTIKLLNVCRLRRVPILAFINKMDRDVREPLDVIDEIERVLTIRCAPITWPVGMGRSFRGVYHFARDEMVGFTPGAEPHDLPVYRLNGPRDSRLDELFPMEIAALRNEAELVTGACDPFDRELFLKGAQAPVFFGSAINNFGVRELLNALTAWAPSPKPRDAGVRTVDPTEPRFSGFVFKIQANMDPRHRDRIAFLRICSGRLRPGLMARHARADRDIKIANPVTFLANERSRVTEAVAGDVIGIHNNGQFQIGDTLTEGEALAFKGIPHFAPEVFRQAQLLDPFKNKQLTRALIELGEEGAIQVFYPLMSHIPVLGAVGELQFEIVAHRLATEYNVQAAFSPLPLYGARWIRSTDRATLREFQKLNEARLARDVDQNLILLADNRVALDVLEKNWPSIQFLPIREHGEQVSA